MKSHRFLLPVLLSVATAGFAQQTPASVVPNAVKPAPAIPANAPHAAEIRDARQAAEAWLGLLDNGQFDQAYAQMGQAARSQISQQQWKSQLQATRTRSGKLESRIFQYPNYATTLKGAPAGQYVILDYLCTFTSHQTAPETIVMAKDNTGWHVAGFKV